MPAQQAVDAAHAVVLADAVDLGKMRGDWSITRLRCVCVACSLAEQGAQALLELVDPAFHRRALGGQQAIFLLQIGVFRHRHQQFFNGEIGPEITRNTSAA